MISKENDAIQDRTIQDFQNIDPSGRLMKQIISLFEENSIEWIPKLERSIERKEWPTVRFAAHRIRSSCLNLGAKDAAEVCWRIERLCDSKAPDSYQATLELYRLKSEIEANIQRLQDLTRIDVSEAW